MRKRIIPASQQDAVPDNETWLSLESIAEVEVTSEDAAHPVEFALQPGHASGWRSSQPGRQTIRLLFADPQPLRRIWLHFTETDTERTQEYVLRYLADGADAMSDIVRQQWNFSPGGATTEIEDHGVELPAVKMLELSIYPDTSGKSAIASLAALRLA